MRVVGVEVRARAYAPAGPCCPGGWRRVRVVVCEAADVLAVAEDTGLRLRMTVGLRGPPEYHPPRTSVRGTT